MTTATVLGSDTMPTASRIVPDATPILKLEGKKLGALNESINEMPIELSAISTGLPTPTAGTIKLENLISNPNNPRSAEHVSDNATDLLPSIRMEGLKTPLAVELMPTGKALILQGESRYVALQRGMKDKTLPKTLTDAVPCVIYKGLTPSQRESLINDHGTSKGLTRPETVQKCWALAAQQISKQEIAVIMRGALLQSYCKPATAVNMRAALASVDPADRRAVGAAVYHVLRQSLGEQILPFAHAPESIREARYAWERVACGELTADAAAPFYAKVGFKPDAIAAQKLASAMRNDLRNNLWVPGQGGPIWNKTIADLKAPAVSESATTGSTSYAIPVSQLRETVQLHARHPAIVTLLSALTDKDVAFNVNPVQTALEFLDAIAAIGPAPFQEAVKARSVAALQAYFEGGKSAKK